MRVGAIPKGRGVYFEDAAIKLLGGACFGLGARLVTECPDMFHVINSPISA
jgi:hypothetical protein